MIQRHLTEKIQFLATKFPVISITGPRQSGKTTLAQAAFPGYAYANLENLPTRKFAKENPEEFLTQSETGLIVDEAQYVPELFSYIQVRVDETRRNGEYILSGSQNFLLMEKITQSLAGRVAIFHLLPFSMKELKGTEFELASPLEYISKGFYPRIYDQDVPVDIFYPSYTLTYLERDVRLIQNVGDLDLFREFVELCAGRIGQLFNQSSIANDAGITHPTVKKWLSILKTGFQVFTLRPYHQNFRKRIVKTPKLYFYDTGLACSLLGIQSPGELANHWARGALFENFIIVELMKQFYNRGRRPRFYFWRDKTGHEIDLIVDQGTTIHPIEIKSGTTLNTSFFKNLDYFNRISENDPKLSYLVYGGSENQNRSRANVRGWASLPEFT
ncbi:MAG TPA: ATP-binding protein [Bacteroidetes bacterium]|nr:ATP-binding protein [Bacteroidota bacterium]